MDISLVYDLMDRLENSSIDGLELEMDGIKLKLNKNSVLGVTSDVNAGQGFEFKESKTKSVDVRSRGVGTRAKGVEVRTKVAGTFYSAPGPDSEPFVTVGEKVNKGDVIGIIEAMKMMNDIVAPVSGTISQILVSNEQMVGYDDLLITIEE